MNENKIKKGNYYNKEKFKEMIQVLEKDFKETIVNIKDELINTQTQILSDANSRLICLYFKLGKIINDNFKW